MMSVEFHTLKCSFCPQEGNRRCLFFSGIRVRLKTKENLLSKSVPLSSIVSRNKQTNSSLFKIYSKYKDEDGSNEQWMLSQPPLLTKINNYLGSTRKSRGMFFLAGFSRHVTVRSF